MQLSRTCCALVQVEDAVLPREETASATRARDPNLRPAGEGRPQQTAVSVVKQEESRWQKQWAEMQDKVRLRLHMPCNPLTKSAVD